MKTVTFKLDDNLAKHMQKAMGELYTTKTEFIREAIRDKIITDKLRVIQQNAIKKNSPPSRKELLRQLDSDELFGKYNLN